MPENDSPPMETIAPSTQWQEGDEMFLGIYTVIRIDRHKQVAQDQLIIGKNGYGDQDEMALSFHLNNEDESSELHQVILNRETGRIAWPGEGNPWSADFICERLWSAPALHVGPEGHSGGVNSFAGTWGDDLGEKTLVGVRHLDSSRLEFADFAGIYSLEREGSPGSAELTITPEGNLHYDGKRLQEVMVDAQSLQLTWPRQDACAFSAEITLKEVVSAADRVYRCGLEGVSRESEGSQPKNLSGVRDDLRTLVQKYSGVYDCTADFLMDSLHDGLGAGTFSLLEDGSLHWSRFYPSRIEEVFDLCASGDMLRYRFKVAGADTVFVAVHRFRDDRWSSSLEFNSSDASFVWLFLLRTKWSCDVYLYEDDFTRGGVGLFLTGRKQPQFSASYSGRYSVEVIRHKGDKVEVEQLSTMTISQPGDNFLRIFDGQILHAAVTGDNELSWGENPPRYPCLPMPANNCSADLRFSDGSEPDAHFPQGHKGKLFEGTLTKDGCTHLVRGVKI